MELIFTPGTVIRLSASPEWGEGRVQSCIGHKLTVDFDHQGKVTLDTRHAQIELVKLAD